MPLAHDMRPESIDGIIGQEHLLGVNGVIRKMIRKDNIQSMILWGPPGNGKTTIARCLANDTASAFEILNATNSKIADIRKTIDTASKRKKNGTSTIVFIDEIHRWSKNVQDALLPYVEDGTITLIGATTEKPEYAVNSALLSRLQVFKLYSLTNKDMLTALLKVVGYYKKQDKNIKIDKNVAIKLINRCSGDIRKLISVMETIVEVLLEGDIITADHIDAAIPNKFYNFDKSGNEHFDYAQNMQCAIQCSDASSAVYWLAKWLLSGEDPVYIARRILVSSSEDCQDPFVSCIANNAYIASKEIGYPECKINMAHAVIAIATAKRNRTAINAISKAIYDIENSVAVIATEADKSNHVSEAGYSKINRNYL